MPDTDFLRRLFRRRTVCGPTRAATFEQLTALKPMTLVPRRAPHDYDVLDGGRTMGRIYKINAATETWRWGISLPLNSCEIYGDAPTREDAMAAFWAEYERWITPPEAGAHGGKRTKGQVRKTHLKGDGSIERTLARLDRDYPELAERVRGGDLSANAAAIEAGFRKKPTKKCVCPNCGLEFRA